MTGSLKPEIYLCYIRNNDFVSFTRIIAVALLLRIFLYLKHEINMNPQKNPFYVINGFDCIYKMEGSVLANR